MLLREYAIKWWFVIPPLLTNVSALPGETWTWTPEIVFSVMLYTLCLKNDTALACYIFDTHQPILIIFIDNKVVLLITVCKYYFSPSDFFFGTQYTAWLKRQFSGVHISPGTAETLVRRGGIANHYLIAYSLSNISAKNN